MTLSEFEKQRQANIERNKKLLSSLNLQTITGDISRGINKAETKEKAAKAARPRVKSKPKPKVEKVVTPIRRSRRLAGVGVAGEDQLKKERELEQAESRIKQQEQEYESLKNIRISGSLNLSDLVKSEGENSIKDLVKGEKFSSGDYYDLIVKNETAASKDVKQLRDEFSKIKIYEQWHAKDLKITPERVQYIGFHPSSQLKLVLAGDIMGHLGIFNADNHTDIDITNFKLHTRNISKIEFNYNDLNKVFIASSDGSIRMIDLEKFKSDEFFVDQTDESITDMEIQGNDMFYATKNGEFGKIDIRSPKDSNVILRLSDKKIGGFAVNPLNSDQLATASLDRTMKLWDLRYHVDCDWSKYGDEYKSAGNYAIFDSRLSVSTVDWNRSNELLCNGYDDTINIFPLSEQNPSLAYTQELEDPAYLVPKHSIKHNCQSGRWVSILKARWQRFGNDSQEKFVIGNMSRFFDIYDNKGNQLGHLSDSSVTNVPAACNFHPRENWVVGAGSSSKVYLYY